MAPAEAMVIVYTRPGSPFSAALRRLTVPVGDVDIWRW